MCDFLFIADTTNIIEWACDILLTMRFDVEERKKKGASRDKKRSSRFGKALSKHPVDSSRSSKFKVCSTENIPAKNAFAKKKKLLRDKKKFV